MCSKCHFNDMKSVKEDTNYQQYGLYSNTDKDQRVAVTFTLKVATLVSYATHLLTMDLGLLWQIILKSKYK